MEAKSSKDKYVSTAANFLYEFMCWDWCIKIQINEQSKEFVSQVAEMNKGLL